MNDMIVITEEDLQSLLAISKLLDCQLYRFIPTPEQKELKESLQYTYEQFSEILHNIIKENS